jgi:hypothetical protein
MIATDIYAFIFPMTALILLYLGHLFSIFFIVIADCLNIIILFIFTYLELFESLFWVYFLIDFISFVNGLGPFELVCMD